MNWIFLALLTPALYTIVNFIDKFIIEKKVRDYRGMPIYGAIVGTIFGTLFWFFSGRPILGLLDATILIATGVLTIWAYAIYFIALSQSQTSLIIIMLQMTPIISLILSYFILGETISFKQLIGFMVILSSVIGLSLKKSREKFKLSQAFWLILITDIIFALSYVLIKFTINATSFSKILSYESWGIGLGGIILFLAFKNIRNSFMESITTVGKSVLGIMFLNEGIFIVTKVLSFLAVSLGPVSLVSVLGGTQVFYGIIFGWILTTIFPAIFNEDISNEGILKKITLSAMLFIGIWLIY